MQPSLLRVLTRAVVLAVFLALSGTFAVAAERTGRGGEEVLPVPPIPPDRPMALEAAPVPNSFLRGPIDAQPTRAELSPTLMGPTYTYQGEGFMRGSTIQSEQNRKSQPAAGINLTVPLR